MFHLNQQIEECEAYLSKYSSINIAEATADLNWQSLSSNATNSSISSTTTTLHGLNYKTDSFSNLVGSPSAGAGVVSLGATPVSSSLTDSRFSPQHRGGGVNARGVINQHRRMHSFPNIQINMAKKEIINNKPTTTAATNSSPLGVIDNIDSLQNVRIIIFKNELIK